MGGQGGGGVPLEVKGKRCVFSPALEPNAAQQEAELCCYAAAIT